VREAFSYELSASSLRTKKRTWAGLWGLAASCALLGQGVAPGYLWLKAGEATQPLERRIAPPPGYPRVPVAEGSFEAWLRGLPLKPGRPPVLLHDGGQKGRQDVHEAVVALDVGRGDLQQCADAIIRLRAEYFFAKGEREAIRFKFTSGDVAAFSRWAEGYRPQVAGSRVRWVRSAPPDASHASLRAYLDSVFQYAGSYSLSREMRAVRDPAEVKAGDVFIRGGFPGHAVIVLDVARSLETGRKVMLLGQSYMPAQEVHVLKNLGAPALSPWYDTAFGEALVTPEWTFSKGEVKRF
jgi:hypothetical protein